jgi:hypothetical protein
MKIKGTSVSPTLSVTSTLISTLLSWSIILEYLSLPVSPTTSPQSAFRFTGVSVAYRCESNAEGREQDARRMLAATSTISCF